jgi:hypothetical protein
MEIESCLYITGPKTHSIAMMRGIIDSLAEQDKEQLKKQYAALSQFNDGGTLEQSSLENIYRELTTYLHKTYLQEINIPIVPSGSLPGTVDKPSKEAVPKRLGAKL